LILPYIAIEAGWAASEIGRQPWIVYGLMKVGDAVSTVLQPQQVWTSLVALVVLYSVLLLLDVVLLMKAAKTEPENI
jgi:cytochrome d ubiquinol oxidase subunit I